MPIFTFLVAWIFAVCAMTGFSALISKIIGREVREHHLLAQLLNTLKSDNIRKPPSVLKGWIIHFVMGLFFLALYELLWILTAVDRNFLWSIIYGMFMGVIGIFGWMIMFKLHPDPPKLHFNTFYVQLFFAHIVFSVVALVVYRFLQ